MICVQLLTLTVAQFKNNVAPLGMTGMPQRGESCGVTCVGLGVKPYGDNSAHERGMEHGLRSRV